MRLIDADRLKIVLEKNFGHTGGANTLAQLIDAQPTIEPERKKGTWIPFDIPWYRCSECGAERENTVFMEYFCPNCGADMREENES